MNIAKKWELLLANDDFNNFDNMVEDSVDNHVTKRGLYYYFKDDSVLKIDFGKCRETKQI